MDNLKLSEIWIYPIKSLGGISLESAIVERRGLQYDRRWMLVDEQGVFLTQRKHKIMALLQVRLTENGFKVMHKIKDISPVYIPFDAQPLEYLKVKVWNDECEAFTINNDINHWFSDVLGISCKLVYMPDNSYRQVDIRYAKEGDIVNFADGYPMLIIGQTALDKLNGKLAEAIPMNRFRPNLVYTGGQANEEDTWKEFKIGNIVFLGVKPCARCVVTTINQDSGEAGTEPLKTLATYRKKGKKILFGQNVISHAFGDTIQVGEPIEIVKS